MSALSLNSFHCQGLDPIDLELPEGSFTTLAGASGSGKTRLLRALADLDPHEGEIRLNSQPSTSVPPSQWRSLVGLLPAESHWWEPRIGDHFKVPPGELIEALGLTVDCLEWETQRISSGERQRLALARLLSGQPEVLLLDEPTANLDQENIERVEMLVEGYRKTHNATVLWVSHDPLQRRRVGERHLIISNGSLEEEQWN